MRDLIAHPLLLGFNGRLVLWGVGDCMNELVPRCNQLRVPRVTLADFPLQMLDVVFQEVAHTVSGSLLLCLWFSDKHEIVVWVLVLLYGA